MDEGYTTFTIVAGPQPQSEVATDAAYVVYLQSDNQEFGVFDRVDDAVLAGPDSPQVWIADQRPSTARSWVGAQRVDGLDDTADLLLATGLTQP